MMKKILLKIVQISKTVGKFLWKVLKKIGAWFKRAFQRNITLERQQAKNGYLFVLPWIIGFLGLFLYPLGRTIYMSFNNVIPNVGGYVYRWVGLDNFARILTEDIDFVLEAQNYVVRVLVYTPVIITLSIIIAMLLNQDIKGKGIFRMIFFLPIIILNGELLANISDYGGMDITINGFVLDMIYTIVPEGAFSVVLDLFSYIIEILWYTGVPILIFLAMLQKVDKSLFEAAAIDGASSWSIFWKITLPILRSAITVSIIFIVVFLANFDGNPINSIILTSMNDSARSEGYASAMSIIYSFIQLVIIGILLLFSIEKERKRV